MSEVVEMLLTVQRQWMYLESIFMSSEDIRKQLPEEAVLFDQVNDDYKAITKAIVEEPNAIKATHREYTGDFDRNGRAACEDPKVFRSIFGN